MQTFLPYVRFDQSARALDTRRLGKQRVEAMQILRALTVERYGWKHHPAVRMWSGHEEALAAYGVAMCREWCARGFSDTCEAKILADAAAAGLATVRSQDALAAAGELPSWLGDDAFHRSHRSVLVRKDPEHYRHQFDDADGDLEYVWPRPGSGGVGSPR